MGNAWLLEIKGNRIKLFNFRDGSVIMSTVTGVDKLYILAVNMMQASYENVKSMLERESNT